MTDSLLIKGATVITLDRMNRVFEGDVLIEQNRIAAVGGSLAARGVDTIEGRGRFLLPGFVQTHIHLCQTLFRGAADDLALIDWLKKRIWPMEAAHTRESISASARLGLSEMIRGGTTCALTMETVRHTEAVFEAVEEAGFRATVGKCMMDKGDDVPAALREKAESSIGESVALIEAWHNRAQGRIRACFAPRFAVSCTRELLERVARLAREMNVMVHTHASENRDEIALVESETGRRNVEYLNELGIAGPHVLLAHCVWLNDDEIDLLARTETRVAHCPSSNLKLGSGVSPVPEMIERGVSVSLGADGAPCNNRLDMFTEMRTAALIQKARLGPQALPALDVLRMATVEGARALGLGDELGSVETGKLADLILINAGRAHTTPRPDPVSTVVYAATASDVETVIIDGRIVMRDGWLTTLNEQEVITTAEEQFRAVSSSLSS
ncbi:MAG TPA: 5'-deoxyadenosine deaminase [Blastocatellia bacterium]|nr:5'-deoxyadenosine deaminase [Blastocatellia bacterium]